VNDLEYREDYADDPVSHAAFRSFLIDIHGLDLTLWEERVGWDRDFVCFSFFAGDEIVASTSIYTVDMILRGQWHRVAQVSSVGTREPWRRRGLNAELTRRAMDWVRARQHRGTFLFSDDDAVVFYGKQGFTEQVEWIHSVPVSTTPRSGRRLLDYDRDENLIRRLVESRTPVSLLLGARSPKLELFHLLYRNAGELRYVEEFDVLVAADEEEGKLSVYDVIGPELPPWKELEAFVIDPSTASVSLAFTPDRLGVGNATLVEDRSSRLHVIAQEGLFPDPGMIPFTAHA